MVVAKWGADVLGDGERTLIYARGGINPHDEMRNDVESGARTCFWW